MIGWTISDVGVRTVEKAVYGRMEAEDCEVSVLFTDDSFIADLNLHRGIEGLRMYCLSVG